MERTSTPNRLNGRARGASGWRCVKRPAPRASVALIALAALALMAAAGLMGAAQAQEAGDGDVVWNATLQVGALSSGNLGFSRSGGAGGELEPGKFNVDTQSHEVRQLFLNPSGSLILFLSPPLRRDFTLTIGSVEFGAEPGNREFISLWSESGLSWTQRERLPVSLRLGLPEPEEEENQSPPPVQSISSGEQPDQAAQPDQATPPPPVPALVWTVDLTVGSTTSGAGFSGYSNFADIGSVESRNPAVERGGRFSAFDHKYVAQTVGISGNLLYFIVTTEADDSEELWTADFSLTIDGHVFQADAGTISARIPTFDLRMVTWDVGALSLVDGATVEASLHVPGADPLPPIPEPDDQDPPAAAPPTDDPAAPAEDATVGDPTLFRVGVWSATLGVGSLGSGATQVDGYSFWTKTTHGAILGSLSSDRFAFDGQAHDVRVLGLEGDKLALTLAASRGADGVNESFWSSDFELNIGGTSFLAHDADVASVSLQTSESRAFSWNAPGLSWNDGDDVAATLRMPVDIKDTRLVPTGLTAELVNHQVVLQWNAPELGASDVVGYRIFRSKRGEFGSTVWVGDTGSGATSYTSTNLESDGAVFTFSVAALYHEQRIAAESSDGATVTMLRPFDPQLAPQGAPLTEQVYNGVSITWNPPEVDAASVTGYRIHRLSSAPIGGQIGVRQLVVADTRSTETTYIDTEATLPGGYEYTVTALRGSAVSAQSPDSQWLVVISDPRWLAPTELTLNVVNHGVELSWKAPARETDPITGYLIMRLSTVQLGDYLPGHRYDIVADTQSTTTSYLDTAAIVPGHYQYQVVALRGEYRSAPTEPQTVNRQTAGIALPAPTPGRPPSSGAPDLTVTMNSAADDHDGRTPIPVELRFSDSVQLFTQQALDVSGGRVVQVQSEVGFNDTAWRVEIEPTTLEDLTIAIAANRDCATDIHAICTQDGRSVSNAVQLVLPGPGAHTAITASFYDVPVSHDGSTDFDLDVRFSQNPAVGFEAMRQSVFTVSGGTLTSATRNVQGSNQDWNIDIDPTSPADVTVVLQRRDACSAVGAICSADGSLSLHRSVTVTIPGPETTSPLIALAKAVPSSHDGSSSFTFELHFSESVETSAAAFVSDVFRVNGGTITSVTQSIADQSTQWLVTVVPTSPVEVTIALPQTESCSDAGAVCTADNRRLRQDWVLTVNGPGS